jgi:hypothetical protein
MRGQYFRRPLSAIVRPSSSNRRRMRQHVTDLDSIFRCSVAPTDAKPAGILHGAPVWLLAVWKGPFETSGNPTPIHRA